MTDRSVSEIRTEIDILQWARPTPVDHLRRNELRHELSKAIERDHLATDCPHCADNPSRYKVDPTGGEWQVRKWYEPMRLWFDVGDPSPTPASAEAKIDRLRHEET